MLWPVVGRPAWYLIHGEKKVSTLSSFLDGQTFENILENILENTFENVLDVLAVASAPGTCSKKSFHLISTKLSSENKYAWI